jgi:hypothetical protein
VANPPRVALHRVPDTVRVRARVHYQSGRRRASSCFVVRQSLTFGFDVCNVSSFVSFSFVKMTMTMTTTTVVVFRSRHHSTLFPHDSSCRRRQSPRIVCACPANKKQKEVGVGVAFGNGTVPCVIIMSSKINY